MPAFLRAMSCLGCRHAAALLDHCGGGSGCAWEERGKGHSDLFLWEKWAFEWATDAKQKQEA